MSNATKEERTIKPSESVPSTFSIKPSDTPPKGQTQPENSKGG